MDKDIMNVTIENLAQKQFEFLKQHSLDILRKAIKLVEEEKFEEIKKMLAFSSSGDWGDDNYFIDFDYNGDSGKDIMEIVNKMQQLKDIITKTSKKER